MFIYLGQEFDLVNGKYIDSSICSTDILGVTIGSLEVVHTDRNNEVEEEMHKGMHYLHKKLIFFQKRESSIEEYLDGSKMERVDPIQTIGKLKTSLKDERKALSALYAELEEERSASAIAANQTMAMITRLQEEKAAMQMEALQYQRMMEELMIKREKEKEELEKELEVYRNKVFEYETKGNTRVIRSSACCIYVEEREKLLIDLNRDTKYEDSSSDAVGNLEETTMECVNHVSTLDESLIEFEEERLTILDQLKALEDKLLTMGDDDQFMDDLTSIKDSFNGFDEHNDGRTMASMAKSLLPFLDATDNGTDEGSIHESKSIEEEVDHVYGRLQALERDHIRLWKLN